MKDNLDIFIFTHKDFNTYPTNPVYKIITDKDVNISVPLEVFRDGDHEIYPRSFSYAEGSRIYWIYKNYPIKDYIGFCHYRTYFDFMDNIPDMDEIFSKYKVITVEPLNVSSIIKQYSASHYIQDLNTLMDLIDDDKIKNELNNTKLYIRNMYIMKKEDFLDCCKTIFGYMLKFDEKLNLKTDEDTRKLHNSSLYQSRVDGFLLERLTSMYISSRFKPDEIKTYGMKTTENRFWNMSK